MAFISHIDFRVRDVACVLPLYDVLFTALGRRAAPTRTAVKAYACFSEDGMRQEWFNLYEDTTCTASPTRIAFRATSRQEVDKVLHAIRPHAKMIEGPDDVERTGEFAMSYYGVFFEDVLGNKFEVCYCVMPR